MTTIVIFGGTGYTGSKIARRAASRGHSVVSVSRTVPAPDDQVPGVRYESGSVFDSDTRQKLVAGADVVISSLFPRDELLGNLAELNAELAIAAAAAGARFGVVGGHSSLRLTADGPRMAEVENPDAPPELTVVRKEMFGVLKRLETTPADVDWFYVSPAAQFGSHAPGVERGSFRVGGEVALFDADGVSAIGGDDFAHAIVDEIEQPAHHRAQLSVAY